MVKTFVAACVALLITPALADAPAGLLAKGNKEDLPPLTIAAGQALSAKPWKLKSGRYYEVEIIADGSQELALEGSGFFRAIWVDELVVEGLEIRPFGVHSLEFDDAGKMELGFVAIKPGKYELRVPQSKGDNQRLEIVIE